jgi:uncharacterized protein with PQ loop repeat
MFVEALGWVAAIFAATLASPQVIRLLKTQSTAGVSSLAWQIVLAANLAWMVHGVSNGHANIWVPNLILALCSATILYQIARHGERNAGSLFLPALGLGGVTSAVDLTAGAVAFAVAAFTPSAIAQLAQLRELIISPSIHGVSMVFLVMNVINQILWVSWALLADVPSVAIVGFVIGTLMAANLLWATLRKLGVVRARLSSLSA